MTTKTNTSAHDHSQSLHLQSSMVENIINREGEVGVYDENHNHLVTGFLRTAGYAADGLILFVVDDDDQHETTIAFTADRVENLGCGYASITFRKV